MEPAPARRTRCACSGRLWCAKVRAKTRQKHALRVLWEAVGAKVRARTRQKHALRMLWEALGR